MVRHFESDNLSAAELPVEVLKPLAPMRFPAARKRRHFWLNAVIATYALASGQLLAAGPSPDMQKAIRASTFEVVMKKPEKDPLTYEKPLPLDLLPYIERTDAYRSVGTAFALGHNRYVTAAHVLLVGIDSQYGAPALRDADGSVFEIEQILKFSAFQDFVIFSLKNDPGPPGIETNRSPAIDDPVLAVGNALGEGIVIRDGLYTSATAEEQDGRWKWIRFSAAASPGNSGGPLLDGQGRVVGIVIGKSPNENLNYSLPIAEVLDAPDNLARFDQRSLVGVPYLHGTQTYRFKEQFALPLPWSKFERAYQEVMVRNSGASNAALLKTYADTLFPQGKGSESVLYAPDANGFRPRPIGQQADSSWIAAAPDYASSDLGGDGSVSVAYASGVALLKLVRPDNASDDAFYQDSRAFMDMALKGLDLRRPVGTDRVRITSLGAAQAETVYVDHYGRTWQQRTWAVPILDLFVDCWLLPTPDGYSGLVQYVPSSTHVLAAEQARQLVDLIDVSYNGTLAQWRSYLDRRALLPRALHEVTLQTTPQWTLRSTRFEFSIPSSLLSLTDKSILSLTMGFFPAGTKTLWDIEEAWFSRDAQYRSSIGLMRRVQPPKSVKRELHRVFDDMRGRHAPYNGDVDRDGSTTWSVAQVLDVAGSKTGSIAADLLYAVILRTDSDPDYGNRVQLERHVAGTTHILERGMGEELIPAASVGGSPQGTYEALAGPLLSFADQNDERLGHDMRGRTYGVDLRDLLATVKAKYSAPAVDALQLSRDLHERVLILWTYWSTVPALIHNRDLWGSFQSRNHLPLNTPHSKEVVAAEQALTAALRAWPATEEWTTLSQQLTVAYIKERHAGVPGARPSEEDYRARVSPCPPSATGTSGSTAPKTQPLQRSPAEFYPDESRRNFIEGSVVLFIRVSATGCAERFAISASSGSAQIDDAAQRYAETMEFLPAEYQGRAVESTKPLRVTFQMNVYGKTADGGFPSYPQ